MLLANGSMSLVNLADVYQSSVDFERTLTALYEAQQQGSGNVLVSIQGKQYLSRSQTVAKRDAVSIAAVLRTVNAWADRVKVRVAYQLKDKYGSSMVNTPSSVDMVLGAPSSSVLSPVSQGCSVPAALTIGHCSTASLLQTWFTASARTSGITVSVRVGGVLVDSVTAGTLTLNAVPSWWDAALRSTTVGSGRSAPAGVPSGGGVFVSLPTSPVHAGEVLDVFMYAHTNALPLTAWRVRLYFSSSHLAYDSSAQNAQFNSASSSVSTDEVSWLAAGLKSTTSNADVTGTAIYLLRVRVRVLDSVAAGTYDGATLGLYPRATELISGGAFVVDLDGSVFDGRNSVQTRGQLVVSASAASAGIFVSAPGGVLANLAALTGSATTYPLNVVEVSDDDRSGTGSPSSVAGASCVTTDPTSVLTLSGCSVLLGASQTASLTGASVNVIYSGHSRTASYDVYAPPETSLWLSDSTLNRFSDSTGSPTSECAAGGVAAYPYQRARVVV